MLGTNPKDRPGSLREPQTPAWPALDLLGQEGPAGPGPIDCALPEEWILLRLLSRPPGPTELSASTGLCPGVGGANVGPPLPIALRGRYCPLCKARGAKQILVTSPGHWTSTCPSWVGPRFLSTRVGVWGDV